ncbi:AAA family ATPase [Burkholderia vietnamiensis]|uniref:AAA family ATPase n=1 Tax=Burkholderia vietnamiensis TaxID=60552 RepID=UPI000D78AE1E|nr:AAA family ATPase [Burkholderia vietnamiensis]GBH25666.1 pilus assembly-related protein [Burkholderia vietnamiensis]
MINILVASDDTARLMRIARLVSDAGRYRVTRAAGRPSQIEHRTDGPDSFDILLIDSGQIDAAELAALERICRQHPGLTGILVSADASPQMLLDAMRAGARDVLQWPIDTAALARSLERAAAQSTRRAGDDTRIISFTSCKGGAGTSFVASNVAYEISEQFKRRVLLIDLNQQYADAAFLVSDETPPSTLPQLCAQIERIDGAFLDASLAHVTPTFHVLAGAGDPVKAAEMREDALEWILGGAAPRYDFVIFDIGVSISALSMVALDRSDQIQLVLQPAMPHVRAGRRMLEILVSLGYSSDQLRLVVNRMTRAGERTRTALEEVLGLHASTTIPDDADTVREAIDQGYPVSRLARPAGVARAVHACAKQIVEGDVRTQPDAASSEPLMSRLFGRKATPKLKSM